jgi:hypothetical protein
MLYRVDLTIGRNRTHNIYYWFDVNPSVTRNRHWMSATPTIHIAYAE